MQVQHQNAIGGGLQRRCEFCNAQLQFIFNQHVGAAVAHHHHVVRRRTVTLQQGNLTRHRNGFLTMPIFTTVRTAQPSVGHDLFVRAYGVALYGGIPETNILGRASQCRHAHTQQLVDAHPQHVCCGSIHHRDLQRLRIHQPHRVAQAVDNGQGHCGRRHGR